MPSPHPRYRALLFDVMGTLVREPFFDVVPNSLGMTMDELMAAKGPRAWVDFELGSIDEATLRARFFADGRDYDHDGMKAAMVAHYDWLPGLEAILRQLHRAGHELHLLSNYPDWYRLIEQKLGLSQYAKWSFVSCDMGVRKPDEQAYLIPARELGVAPEQLLFVDDRAVNCNAARQLGLDAILFESGSQLASELVKRNLLVD